MISVGKFYQAKDVDNDEKRSVLILEADTMQRALSYLNEGFLYNGFTHKNNLKFFGCYLCGSTLNSESEKEE